MPIRFRCSHCEQLLSISRRKAGLDVSCPTCAATVRVPIEETVHAGPLSAAEIRRDPWRFPEEPEQTELTFTRRQFEDDGLDMTPMVDVTFLLLIFFMITASFSIAKTMPTQAPDPDTQGAAQTLTIEDFAEDSVVVEVDADNRIRVDDTLISDPSELVEVLSAKMANERKTEMLIEPDYRASHGTVVTIIDAGMAAGMQHIRRATRGTAD